MSKGELEEAIWEIFGGDSQERYGGSVLDMLEDMKKKIDNKDALLEMYNVSYPVRCSKFYVM